MILRIQQGDRAAAGTLYAWYGDRVYRQVVLPRLPNLEAANDVLAETFVAALSKIDRFTPDRVSIFFWLRRIAINKIIDHYRAQGRHVELPPQVSEDAIGDEPVSEPTDTIDAEETRKMVEASLAKMNPRYADALRLRLLEDRSREECAGVLGINLGTFDVLLHRAAKAFRSVFPP